MTNEATSGIEIDDALRSAITRAITQAGGHRRLAKIIGVAASQPGHWTGTTSRTKTINWGAYERLHPLIIRFLPHDDPKYYPLGKASTPTDAIRYTDVEIRLIKHYRDADPDDQADIYQAARAAAARSGRKTK